MLGAIGFLPALLLAAASCENLRTLALPEASITEEPGALAKALSAHSGTRAAQRPTY